MCRVIETSGSAGPYTKRCNPASGGLDGVAMLGEPPWGTWMDAGPGLAGHGLFKVAATKRGTNPSPNIQQMLCIYLHLQMSCLSMKITLRGV